MWGATYRRVGGDYHLPLNGTSGAPVSYPGCSRSPDLLTAAIAM